MIYQNCNLRKKGPIEPYSKASTDCISISHHSTSYKNNHSGKEANYLPDKIENISTLFYATFSKCKIHFKC